MSDVFSAYLYRLHLYYIYSGGPVRALG